jgi:hypothetical protein
MLLVSGSPLSPSALWRLVTDASWLTRGTSASPRSCGPTLSSVLTTFLPFTTSSPPFSPPPTPLSSKLKFLIGVTAAGAAVMVSDG